MIAVVSMPALNQIDIIPGPVWLPQVEKPQERSPPFSDIREAIRQVIWIKGQCVHDPYKAKQRQPQLQPVYTRSADTAVSGGPKNFIFFIPLVWRIICTQPWPQCPALLDKRACPLAYTIPQGLIISPQTAAPPLLPPSARPAASRFRLGVA